MNHNPLSHQTWSIDIDLNKGNNFHETFEQFGGEVLFNLATCSNNVTLSPVEYLTVEYSTFKTFEKTIITINLDPPQTSKQIYRKLKYSEKVFGEFQHLPRFLRKMVLYSSTKFGILEP